MVINCCLAYLHVGTKEERGIKEWRKEVGGSSGAEDDSETGANASSIYDFPLVGKRLREQKWTRYIPVCPAFDLKSECRKPTCDCCGKSQTLQINDV